MIENAIKNGTPLSKGLEVFDKIKAEIEQTFLDDGAMQEYTVDECLRIIDKHIAECECEVQKDVGTACIHYEEAEESEVEEC